MPQAWDGRGRKATSKSLGVLKGHPSKGDASLCQGRKSCQGVTCQHTDEDGSFPNPK